MIIIYASISMFMLGSAKTFIPTIVQALYGPRTGLKMFPVIYIFSAVSSVTQFVIYNYITNDFETIFWIFSGVSVIGLISAALLDMNPKFKKSDISKKKKKVTGSEKE